MIANVYVTLKLQFKSLVPPLPPPPLPGPLSPDVVEQPENAVITPALLEEEEQLEAAGLERERKMLEKVI